MRDEGDRFVAWRLDDAPATLGADLEDDRMEHALLAYAQRAAARVGAEWFAAEFARREEDERSQREGASGRREAVDARVPDPSPEVTLIDASVEDDVVGGAPVGLGIEPIPQRAQRHPHVPRPPAPEPAPESKRRRRDRKRVAASTPSPAISAPEWARMSPGARRLYGLDASPHTAATG
jgi:hypothetical protein